MTRQNTTSGPGSGKGAGHLRPVSCMADGVGPTLTNRLRFAEGLLNREDKKREMRIIL